MPKSVGGALAAHIAGENTSLATLWHVIRTDDVEFFFTDHDVDLPFGGDTYVSAVGYNRTAVDNKVGLNVDNMDVEGFLDSNAITDADLRAGKFDYAEVFVMVVNWKSLSDGAISVRRGRFGEVVYSDSGMFHTELRGLTQAYSQSPVELYTPTCRADLGDSRCTVILFPDYAQRSTAYALGDVIRVSSSLLGDDAAAIAAAVGSLITEDFDDVYYECTTAGTTAATQPAYDSTPGNDTTDGSAVFTAVEAFTRAATVATVTDNRTFTVTFPNGADSREVADWFNYGAVVWDTGNNAGLVMEVKDFVASSDTVTLFLTMPFDIQVGDKMAIYAGCDKRLTTCINKFSNVDNFRGEPFIPGPDEYLSIQTTTGTVDSGGKF